MTNPYYPGSDYDSMAGAINPAKLRLLGPRAATSMQKANLAQALRGMPRGPRVISPAQQEAADAFELARGDESLFGMDSGSTLVAAGTGGTVYTSPQKPCVPSRMIVSDTTANAFVLSSLTVGVEPLLLTNGTNLSLAAFTPQSTAPSFRSVLCHVGNTIAASVTNISGAGARFIATIYAVPWTVGPGYFE